MFDSLSERLGNSLRDLRGKGRLSDADIDATAREIRIALLEADVALPVVRGVHREDQGARQGRRGLRCAEPRPAGRQDRQRGARRRSSAARPGAWTWPRSRRRSSCWRVCRAPARRRWPASWRHWLKGQGHTPLLVACDLQRPNAVNQLQIVGERAGVPTFAPHPGATGAGELPEGPGDPVGVARDGIAHARSKQYDVVIVDTAGRLGVDAELMQQASDIRDAVTAGRGLFVVDAMIGQDAVATAEAFRDGVGFTGVVLTKLDGDARGGAALSRPRGHRRSRSCSPPTARSSTDFDVFHPDRMASRILGHGRPAHPDRAGRAGLRRGAGGRRPRPRSAPASCRWRTSSSRCWRSARWVRSATSSACCPAPTGPDEGRAGPGRRQADGQAAGHHPRHDAGRAGRPEDHQRRPGGCASPTAPA